TGRRKMRCVQAEDVRRARNVTGVQTCALPIWSVTVVAIRHTADGAATGVVGGRVTGTDDALALLESAESVAAGADPSEDAMPLRSEERRVGKEGGQGGSEGHRDNITAAM